MKITTGDKIRRIRLVRGLTQTQLGKLCGMADSQVGTYERDEAKARPETLKRIADALGVSVDDLREVEVGR
jgi:transcriptional regulator with XRE-family HTH domain